MNSNHDSKKRIKIIFAVSVYEINGACSVARNLINNFDKERFEIIMMAESVAKKHFELGPNIRLVDLGLKPTRGFARKIPNIYRHIRKIKRTIVTESPDVVLSFGTILNCYILLALSRQDREKLKIVISEHSEGFLINFQQSSLRSKVLRKIYKLMMLIFYRKADCIITVSQNIADRLKKFLRQSNKIKVIYNPIDISEIRRLSKEQISDFNFEEGMPYIGVISRLSSEKGVNRVIDSFAELTKKIDSRLLIVGDGQERSALENLAKKYNIGTKISFLGWQDNPFKYLANTKIFVLSSIYEGFPNVILEAMACGIPVITLKSSGGIKEIIEDGKDGILVNSGDPLSLSVTIHNLLLNKMLRENISAEARRKVNRFEVSKIVREYENTMSTLVDRS